MMASAFAGMIVVFTAAVTLLAQDHAAQISFVASVKPNTAAEARGFSEYYPGGRFTATAVTVRTLLRSAYRIQDYQLVSAPSWFSTKRYDIAAKAEGTPPPLQAFLRALLADQFKLAVHNETRELPAFSLVLARGDRRPGGELVKSDFDCDAYARSPHAAPDPALAPACGTRINPGVLWGRAIPLAQLATSLAPFVNRFVFDKTEMGGRFDVKLTWTPDGIAADDSAGPSIFTALQEQLGLKLVAERGPVEVMVVDHVEEPGR
jgi:uncharacterized protein (TIGR03435 family)